MLRTTGKRRPPMTPEERQRVNELFDRLAGLETAPRDAEAEQVIAEGLKRAPNAVYALVQTVLVQDEALRRADARIRELTGTQAPAPTQGGFLDNMRALLGGGQRGSVPSVRPGAAGGDPAYVGAAPASGGSFLGTAAAPAAAKGGTRSMRSTRTRGSTARRRTPISSTTRTAATSAMMAASTCRPARDQSTTTLVPTLTRS